MGFSISFERSNGSTNYHQNQNSIQSGGHTEKGTDYGERGVKAYASSRHGPDGAIFLDPYFMPFLRNLDNLKVLDAGCGAAPWSIYAAQNGGVVCAIDLQEKMIEEAKKAVKTAQVESRVSLDVGSVTDLPYDDKQFDRAISINVGCNLSSPILKAHFEEMARTLKVNGKAVITVPNSLDVVFTNGKKNATEVSEHINSALNSLQDDPSFAQISSTLMGLTEVTSATFAMENGHVVLVTPETSLQPGQQIWRKLPAVVIPNNFHSEDEYLQRLEETGLTLTSIEKPHFTSEDERLSYNLNAPSEAQLGSTYVQHAPFALYFVEKNSSC